MAQVEGHVGQGLAALSTTRAASTRACTVKPRAARPEAARLRPVRRPSMPAMKQGAHRQGRAGPPCGRRCSIQSMGQLLDVRGQGRGQQLAQHGPGPLQVPVAARAAPRSRADQGTEKSGAFLVAVLARPSTSGRSRSMKAARAAQRGSTSASSSCRSSRARAGLPPAVDTARVRPCRLALAAARWETRGPGLVRAVHRNAPGRAQAAPPGRWPPGPRTRQKPGTAPPCRLPEGTLHVHHHRVRGQVRTGARLGPGPVSPRAGGAGSRAR
jgi:hypothetical protein